MTNNKNRRNKQKRGKGRNPASFSVGERGDRWGSRAPFRIQSFLPRRLVATFKTPMLGNYVTATAQPNGQFNINASSFFQPFNTVGTAMGTTGAGKSNITVSAGFSVGSSPLGYSEMDSLYQYYKVRRAEVRVRCLPTLDNVYVSLFPANVQESAVVLPGSSANPYAKTQLCAAGMPPRTLVCSMTAPTVLGYNRTQFEGLTPTLFGAAPGSSQVWFFNIAWSNAVGSTNATGTISFEVELWQEVEISELEIFFHLVRGYSHRLHYEIL